MEPPPAVRGRSGTRGASRTVGGIAGTGDTIGDEWAALGVGALGYPKGPYRWLEGALPTGLQLFQRGAIFEHRYQELYGGWNPYFRPFALYGPTWDKLSALGGPTSLGVPTTDISPSAGTPGTWCHFRHQQTVVSPEADRAQAAGRLGDDYPRFMHLREERLVDDLAGTEKPAVWRVRISGIDGWTLRANTRTDAGLTPFGNELLQSSGV